MNRRSGGKAPERLTRQDFLQVVRLAPVVAIDLVIRNRRGDVLLGLRANEPARATWFVPGGRVLKDETLDDAFARIGRDELGLALERSDARFLGPYEHLYAENFAGEPGLGTHYVVLAYETIVATEPTRPADDQHDEMRWWTIEALIASPDVHDNTKAYFR
jgi:colanic acid biosynthesis protein WcaH